MKKLLAICLSLIMVASFAIPVFAYEGTGEVVITAHVPSNYSITIPASWQGEYTYDIREGENGSYNLTVRHKDSYGTGYGGMLFSISMYSVAEGNGKQIIEEQPIPIDYLGVLKLPNGGEFDMIVTFPTDLQCPFESIDVYNEFYEEGKSVYKTFTSTNGATFEKAQ